MNIYTKIILSTLPLVFFSLIAAVGTTYYFSYNALTDLAEIWLETRLSEAVQAATEQEDILHKYGLEDIPASVEKAKLDAGTAMLTIEIGDQGYIFVVDTRGIIAVHPDRSFVGRDMSGEDWFRKIENNSEGRLTYHSQGVSCLAMYDYFQPWGWYILATDPKKEVYGTVNRMKPYVLFLGIFGSLIMALALMFMTRRLTAPLKLLTTGAERIGQGNLETRISVRTHDELGRLAGVFNSMAAQLEETLTALRHSEEYFRSLIENATDIITILESNGTILYESPSIEKILGYKSEELIGKKFSGFVHSDDLQDFRNVFSKLLRNPDIIRSVEIRFRHKDGSWRILEVISNNLLNDPVVSGVVLNSRDITLRERAMEAISILAGGIAHEFNNTLVGITGNIDLLQMDLPDDVNIDKYAEPMKASALHMAHLTEQLLAYSRGGKYQPKNISLTDFVEETLPLIKQSIDLCIRIKTDLPHDILNVEADFAQMQLVLSAVLNNSAEAIEGEGRIRIIARNEEIDEEFVKTNPELKPGPYVSLTVEDDGKGMDEETRSRIFDPFFTTKFQGRGLGMAAVYGIIANHSGWMSVDSKLGKGTVVRIYLPAVKVQVKEEERLKNEPGKCTGTILVIDDEDVVIDVMHAMLERLGFSILLAKTGKEAVNIAKSFDGDIDLAILDIVLPDLAGKEVYKDIIEARPNLKVIVCSGYTVDDSAQDILDAGAQDFIEKPFSYATLSEKLKKVLEGR